MCCCIVGAVLVLCCVVGVVLRCVDGVCLRWCEVVLVRWSVRVAALLLRCVGDVLRWRLFLLFFCCVVVLMLSFGVAEMCF